MERLHAVCVVANSTAHGQKPRTIVRHRASLGLGEFTSHDDEIHATRQDVVGGSDEFFVKAQI